MRKSDVFMFARSAGDALAIWDTIVKADKANTAFMIHLFAGPLEQWEDHASRINPFVLATISEGDVKNNLDRVPLGVLCRMIGHSGNRFLGPSVGSGFVLPEE